MRKTKKDETIKAEFALFVKQLRNAVERAGGHAEFAAACGVSRSVITKILNGQQDDFSASVYLKIRAHLPPERPASLPYDEEKHLAHLRSLPPGERKRIEQAAERAFIDASSGVKKTAS